MLDGLLAGGGVMTSKEAPEGFKCGWCVGYPYEAHQHKTDGGEFTAEHRMLKTKSLMQEAYDAAIAQTTPWPWFPAEPASTTCECGSGSNAIGPGHSDWCRRFIP
jgi:hypothetical protein